MSAASLFAWIATVLVGLMLLVIWLMEYDPQFQSAAATRLPIPVISTHALLGMAGLLLWGAYLLADEDRLAYATIADLAVAVVLGYAGCHHPAGTELPDLGRHPARRAGDHHRRPGGVHRAHQLAVRGPGRGGFAARAAGRD